MHSSGSNHEFPSFPSTLVPFSQIQNQITKNDFVKNILKYSQASTQKKGTEIVLLVHNLVPLGHHPYAIWLYLHYVKLAIPRIDYCPSGPSISDTLGKKGTEIVPLGVLFTCP